MTPARRHLLPLLILFLLAAPAQASTCYGRPGAGSIAGAVALPASGANKELEGLPFMKGKPWIRHDEHYHVDFAVPCQPMQLKAG